jgi:peptidoglycan hydrolase-like protein with peptidoglycan-binding domain
LFALACASIAASKVPVKKKPAAKAKTHAVSSRATKATAKRSSKTTARSKTAKSRGRSRSLQQAPTPDRYREIQQALAAKGYFQGEPSGEWGPDSVDALKRFQANQNLTADGKLSAMSLIALGLGPKRLSAQTAPQGAAPAPAETPK